MEVLPDDEYESLPPQASMTVHMLAGAAAGTLEHIAMFPFDVIKTRMMRLRPTQDAQYRNIFHAFTTIKRFEGNSALFSGMGIVAMGAGPAHALYFATYEHFKEVFNANQKTHSPIRTAMAAVFATLAHDSFMNPIEVVKQRMQVKNSPYKGPVDCIVTTYRHEGIRAFYRSYTTQMTMNIPFQCTHLVTYETLRKMLNPSGEYDPLTHLIAGAGAGATAAALTNPFDVAKTLLNTQEVCPGANVALQETRVGRKYLVGLAGAMKTIYSLTGWAGFAKGIGARVMFQAPATAISWSVYEFFKFYYASKDEGSSR